MLRDCCELHCFVQRVSHRSTTRHTLQHALRCATHCAMLTPMPNDLIGSTEAARILSIDKATLSRWVTTGQLRAAYKLPAKNGAYFFNRADIETLAAERAAS